MGVTLLWHMFFLLLSSTIASALDSPESYNFAIMPKSIGNSFFFPVREGCQKRAGEYTGNEDTPSVTCEWVGPVDEDPTGEAQAKVLEDIIEAHVNGTHPTHGIAISVMNGPSLVEPIQKALDAGMSVIFLIPTATNPNAKPMSELITTPLVFNLPKFCNSSDPPGENLPC